MFKRITNEAKRIWNWLYAKRSEVAEMDHRDAFMAHIVLEILQTSNRHNFEMIPLYDLLPIHPVDNRENTIAATNARIRKIEHQKDRLLEIRIISKEELAILLPSATYLRAIRNNLGTYDCFEGNGRIAALKAVFSESDHLSVEVDVYQPRKPHRTQKKIKKLRKMFHMKNS